MTPEERYAAIDARLDRVTQIQAGMTARQQYHDEAFERMDEGFRNIGAKLDQASANIFALARIAEIHERRLSDLEGNTEV